MRVVATGQSGYVGRHVVEVLKARQHAVGSSLTEPTDAMIHLAWAGLPNYESEKHFENVEWQFEWIQKAAQVGITNITVAGTCMEAVANPPAYARAKLELHRRLSELPIKLKWVRLPYLYGEGQSEACLLPCLRRALANGDQQFHVAHTSKVFMDVREAARLLCQVAEANSPTGIVSCDGGSESVADFCRRNMPTGAIELVEDYPLRLWEQ